MLLFRSCGASLLHNSDSISPRRPPPPGDSPAHGLAYPPALASLLPPLIPRTECGRKNILMDECYQLVPLPSTKGNLALLPCIKKQESSWFSPNWRDAGKTVRKTEKQTSSRESSELKQEGENQPLDRSQRKRRKRNRALKIWHCALKVILLWHFLKIEVKT